MFKFIGGVIKTFFVLLALLIGVAVFTGGSGDRSSRGKLPEDSSKIGCSNNWRDCSSNQQFVATHERAFQSAQAMCQVIAEERARYGEVDWGGWTVESFSSYTRGDSIRKNETIILADDKAKYMNGFGVPARARTL